MAHVFADQFLTDFFSRAEMPVLQFCKVGFSSSSSGLQGTEASL